MSQSEQAPRISLGAAILQCQPAEGHSVPSGEVPGAWLLDLLAQLGPAQLLAVLQTCRAGRDLALQIAPCAHLTLRITPDLLPSPARQLSVASQALQTRGLQPVKLTIDFQYGGSTRQCQAARQQLVRFLQTAGSSITDLELHCATYTGLDPEQRSSTQFFSSFLSESASGLSRVRRLEMGVGWISIVPPAPHLPSLTSLHITGIFLAGTHRQFKEQFGASVSARLLQLSALQCHTERDDELGTVISLMLPAPGTVSTSLTELDYNGWLTDQLVGVLVDRCPALKSLSVFGVRLEGTDACQGAQWGVERISVRYPGMANMWQVEENELQDLDAAALGDLALLPRSTAERVRLDTPRSLILEADAEGFNPDTLAGLHYYCFHVQGGVQLYPGRDLQSDEQPAALRAALQQLGPLQAPGCVIDLCEWELTPALATAVADCVPALPQLRFNLVVETLTDAALGVVLPIAAHIPTLSVHTLELESDTHANTPWPWEELVLDVCEMESLLCLPDPRGGGGEGRLIRAGLVAMDDYATEAECARLAAWLPHVRLDSIKEDRIDFVVYTADYETEVLRRAEVFRAVRFASPEAEANARLFSGAQKRNKAKVPWAEVARELPAWATRARYE